MEGFGQVKTERDYRRQRYRKFEYDASGRPSRISEWDFGTNWTVFEYDALGRATRVTPPDGDHQAVVTEYVGDSLVRRTVQIAGEYGETPSTTEEEYDRQGRQIRVTESSGEGGAMVSTHYGYDVGGRLSSVTTQAAVGGQQVTQQRLFDYDHLGFLRSEQHPEKGTDGNGLVTYSDYDARGNVGRKTDGPSDLELTYDRAERLTEVREAGPGGRVLKSFEFALGNDPQNPGDLRAGKLVRATRHNYRPSPFNDEVRISETFRYVNPAERHTERITEVDDQPWFRQTWSWLPTSRLGTIGYPSCVTPTCQAEPERKMLQSYLYGNLFKICETSNGTSCSGQTYSFTFHPNGMLRRTRFPYPSRISTDTYMDSNSMQRPRWMWSAQGFDGALQLGRVLL